MLPAAAEEKIAGSSFDRRPDKHELIMPGEQLMSRNGTTVLSPARRWCRPSGHIRVHGRTHPFACRSLLDRGRRKSQPIWLRHDHAHPNAAADPSNKKPASRRVFVFWQPRMDSNHRMPESESGALPLGDGAMEPILAP